MMYKNRYSSAVGSDNKISKMFVSSWASLFSFLVSRSNSNAINDLLRRLLLLVIFGALSHTTGGLKQFRKATICSGKSPSVSRHRIAFALASKSDDKPSSHTLPDMQARCKGYRPSLSQTVAEFGYSLTSLESNSPSE